MKNQRFTSSLAPRSMRLRALAIVAAAGAAGVLAGAGNAAHLQKRQFNQPTLENGVLTVEGTNANDRIALRLQAGQPAILHVDFGDDGSAEFSFERREIAEIVVDSGNGGDAVRIDESNGVFADTIPTTIDGGNGDDRLVAGAGDETVLGGNGNDSLIGGAGAGSLNGGNGDDTIAGGNGNEKLVGGEGNDSIDGNKGNDVAFLGNGDDTFIWDPGDGSDTIEGQDGNDTMVFNGASNAPETVDLSAEGSHLKFFRQPANITMDTHGVERVDFNALGLTDVVTVNDLTGTDVKELNIDLAGSPGGATGDGAADSVIVNGTKGDDAVVVNGSARGVEVNGLVPTVRVLHSEAANDRLDINTLPGADTVNSAGLGGGLIQLFANGVLVQ
jgi:Ca2+-binding RTX toxin-like protein